MTDETVQPEACESCEGAGCSACDPEHYDWTYLKFVADGAATLGEAASRLEVAAAEFRKMERDGWRLDDEVDGGHVNMHKPEKVTTG